MNWKVVDSYVENKKVLEGEIDRLNKLIDNALFRITKEDVRALTEDRDLTDEQMERLFYAVEKMDASMVMEQVVDLIDWTLAEAENETVC